MTNVVRGAGRKRAAATKKRHDQKDPIVGGNKQAALEAAAKAKPAPKAAKVTGAWDVHVSLGANVDALKNLGMTWHAIADLASAHGQDVPWPDGGRLLRARKQFLAGTEGKPKPERRKPGTARRASDPGAPAATVEQKVESAMAGKTGLLPWEENEMDDKAVLEFLQGRKISYVSRSTGNTSSGRIPKESKHNHIKVGANGRYVEFASMEGPFMAVSLDRIIAVS